MQLSFLLLFIGFFFLTLSRLPITVDAKPPRPSIVVHLDDIQVNREEEESLSEDEWETLEKESFCSESDALVHRFTLEKLKTNLVTVYQNGAEVKRVLDEGSLPENWISNKCLRVIISGLSSQIQRETLRVTSPEEISISELQFSQLTLNISSSNETLIQQVQEQLSALPTKVRSVQKMVRELDQLRGELQLLQKKFGDLTSQASPDAFSQFWTFYAQESRNLKNNISELENLYLNDQLESLQREKRELESQLRTLQTPRTEFSESVSLLLTHSFSPNMKKNQKRSKMPILELSYLLGGVSWSPRYEIRGHSKENKASVKYLAEITQNSGESWQATPLVLSTATPFFQPQRSVPEMMRAAPHPAMKRGDQQPVFGGMESSVLADGAGSPRVQSRVQNSFSSVSYRLTRLVSLANSPSAVKIPITDQSFEAKFSYLGFPSRNNEVRSSVKFNNTSDFLFLEGNSNIYLDKTFIGSTHFERAEVGKEIEVSFGVDSTLVFEKSPQKRNEETFHEGLGLNTLFNSQKLKKRTVSESFSIINRKPVEIQLTSQYSLPSVSKARSDDKYPQITLVVPSSEEREQEKSVVSWDPQHSSLLTWNLTIPASARVELFVEYNVIWDPSRDWISE